MKVFKIFFLMTLMVLNLEVSFGKQLLKNSLGIYVSKRGSEILNKNVGNLLFNNGITYDEYYIKEQTLEMEEKPLEQLSDDPEIQDLLSKTKTYLEKFLMGFELADPKFTVDMKDITLSAQWNHFNAIPSKIEPSEKYPLGGVIFQLDIEAKNIRFDLGQLHVRDANNEFLGEFGMDQFWTSMTETSTPLQVSFPIYVYNQGDVKFAFEVKNPFTNLDQIELAADFKSPLVLPKIEININGRTFGLNQQEVEQSVRDARETLIASVQRAGQDYVDRNLAEMLTKLLNEKYNLSGFETNEMAPPGAEEQNPKPFIWGMEIDQVNMIKDNLFLGLNGHVSDPLRPQAPQLALAQNAQKLPDFENESFGDYDVALSINRGFFNRIVQLSYNRGYFNTFDVEGEDEPIKLSQVPIIKIFEKNGKAQAKLDLQIEYKVTGVQSVFVKNPIKIDFDLDLAFKHLADGRVQIVVDGVDMESVNVDKRYIRMFTDKVRNAVKDRFKEVDLKGMELVDELPIPSSIVGVPLKIVGSHWDKNGYIMMLLDIGFDR